MIVVLLTGIALTVLTVAIHASGTSRWIRHLRRLGQKHESTPKRAVAFQALASTAILLLTLHLIEVVGWAVIYGLLPDVEAIGSWQDAFYFSAVTFTTLGYGDIVLTGPWRMLSAIQAATGLLIFGWSTALLFAVVQRTWGD